MRRVCKVLVVEDDDHVRQLLHGVFDDEGYRFATVRNGLEMWRVVEADPAIDVVVIDVLLPGKMNGLVLAQAVAALGYAVILVSGDHSRFEEIEKSGHRYLMKPFRIQSLLQLVETALNETKSDCERPKGRPRAGNAEGLR